MSRRFLFHLQWPVVLLVAMLAGGQTAYRTACFENPTDGSPLVSFSASGIVIVVVIGAIAGLLGMAILGYLPLRLERYLAPWRIRNKLLQTATLLMIAPIVGSGFAMIAMLLMATVFFTMPSGIIDFITTKP